MKPYLLAAGAAALIAGGAYLYLSSRAKPAAATSPQPPPTMASTSAGDTLAGRSQRATPAAARPVPGQLAQRQPMPGNGVTSSTASAPSADAKLAPYPRVDLRKAATMVPGLDDLESDRTQLSRAPASPLAQELSEARAAFRAGDLATAHALARKLSAAEPTNTAARRLAVSTACKLGDKAYVTSAWPDLTGNEQAALTRYCGATTIDLPGLRK